MVKWRQSRAESVKLLEEFDETLEQHKEPAPSCSGLQTQSDTSCRSSMQELQVRGLPLCLVGSNHLPQDSLEVCVKQEMISKGLSPQVIIVGPNDTLGCVIWQCLRLLLYATPLTV